MASKDTGFHSSDPDWTRGRGIAVADADALARRQISMNRDIALRKLARLGQEYDAAQVMAIYDVIYVWPGSGSASITGQWSANTHPEEAVAYVPQRVAEALAWRLRSYTTHDDDCKINKPPHFRDCSCGLRELLASMENSAALTPEPEGDAP